MAVAKETGVGTELGKIGAALRTIEPQRTPLQREIDRLVRVLAVFGVAAVVVVVIVYGLTRGNWLPGVLAGIATAMALLPEESPVVLTVFMTFRGVAHVAKAGADRTRRWRGRRHRSWWAWSNGSKSKPRRSLPTRSRSPNTAPGQSCALPVNNEVVSPIVPTLPAHSLAGESHCGRPPIAEFVVRDSTRSNLALSS